jgi:hypothetical protein
VTALLEVDSLPGADTTINILDALGEECTHGGTGPVGFGEVSAADTTETVKAKTTEREKQDV